MRSPLALLIAVVALLALVVPLTSASPASAGPAFSAFGNYTLGDCGFASAANLVQWRYPTSQITTAQVVGAWRTSGYSGLDYLETSGFAGHRISGYTPVTTVAQMTAGVAAGGVQATILDGAHAVAVIAASSRGLTYITWGQPVFATWPQWAKVEGPLGMSAAAVTWAPSHTTAIEFKGSYETIVTTTQVEPTGTVAPIEDPGIVNLGYQFDGWSVGGSGPLVQTGTLWNFSRGVTLSAVWTYVGAI